MILLWACSGIHYWPNSLQRQPFLRSNYQNPFIFRRDQYGDNYTPNEKMFKMPSILKKMIEVRRQIFIFSKLFTSLPKLLSSFKTCYGMKRTHSIYYYFSYRENMEFITETTTRDSAQQRDYQIPVLCIYVLWNLGVLFLKSLNFVFWMK